MNWLTIGSAKAEKNLTSLMTQQTTTMDHMTTIDRGVPEQVLPSPSPGGSLDDVHQPAMLQDAGRLLVIDSRVSQIKRPSAYYMRSYV